jgi:hypothetical protein
MTMRFVIIAYDFVDYAVCREDGGDQSHIGMWKPFIMKRPEALRI